MPDPAPPAPEIEAPEGASRRLSAVWLVPLLALLLALGVAWHTYARRGPTIEIVFDNAAGVEAGQTTVRFRDVAVGVVERLRLSDDLSQVIVTARIDKDTARFVDADAQFWIVRPSVSAQGVTGIETVLSGVYIGAWWDNQQGPRVDRFVGLPRAPLTPADQPGLRVRLRSPTGGSLAVGAPVLFKSIQVGSIENVELTDAGDVAIDVFVNAPYHLRLTEGTRFWNASGFSIEIGAGGASLNVDSLISLLQGGVSFDTVASDTTPVEAGHVYDLYPTESDARQNFFADDPGERLLVDATFEGSVGGLQPGAPVRFRGIQVGEVEAMQAAIIEDAGEPRPVLRVTLSLSPTRLGVPEDDPQPAAAALDAIAALVERGLRARISASGLLGQTLYVELAELPEVAPALLDRDAEPNPRIPSVPSELSSIAASAEGVLKRVNALPLEELVEDAVTLLGNVNALVTDERVRSAPENLGLLLADARKLLAESGAEEVPGELRALIASARAVVDQATEAELVRHLTETLDGAKAAVASVGTAADGVPALVAEIESLSAEVRALPLEEVVASGSRLLDNMDAFVTSQEVAAVPASLNAAVADLRAILDELKAGGAVDNVNATLAAARRISDELAAAQLAQSLDTVIQEARMAAGNVSAATSELPALIENLSALSGRVEALPLDQLVTSATATVKTADRLLASEGAAEVPPRLAEALEELRGLLAELREGGAVNNLNATLASADRAAEAITAAADDLPALVANLNRVAAQADRALASVGPGSDLNRDTLLLLQEVRDAARSVNSLVLALERRPNSVLFGR